jgi:hypothetical protein
MTPLSPSSIEAFARCPALYHYSRKLRVDESGYTMVQSARVVGRAVHAAAQALREGYSGDLALGAAKATVSNACIESNGPCVEMPPQAKRDIAKVEAMVKGFVAWRQTHALFTTQNEIRMAGPLINPATGRQSRQFSLRGIADAVVERKLFSGEVESGAIVQRHAEHYLYELKTTSDTVHDRLASLRQGIQLPLYAELLRLSHGIEIAGYIVDVIKKPVKPLKKNEPLHCWVSRCVTHYAQDPQRFFAREVWPYEESAVRKALAVAWRTAQAIRDCERYGYDDVPKGESCCKTAYGWCPMKALCWHGSSDGYEFGVPDTRYDDAGMEDAA